MIHIDFADVDEAAGRRRRYTYRCCQCPASFPTMDARRVHELEHAIQSPSAYLAAKEDKGEGARDGDARAYACDKCARTFTSEFGLHVHVGRMHRVVDALVVDDAITVFPCDQCDYVGRTQKAHNMHHAWHRRPKSFKCSGCARLFHTHWACTQHMAMCETATPHSDTESGVEEEDEHPTPSDTMESYSCPLCTYSTKNRATLNSHLYSKHHEREDQPCPWCAFVAATQETLDGHVADAHASDLTQLAVPHGTTFNNAPRKRRAALLV